ncbi:MAG: hypothetical protein FKY71_14835 [Spiribacter salinus]|uniref:Uncharacterized protein n=1 Tax=Spiribacter salinus TaxID=1335746 RepID=A0A540VND1_9GAMM|nr:MAG: hypothetical protein FKY71_14835 [Spiribacter salinus]
MAELRYHFRPPPIPELVEYMVDAVVDLGLKVHNIQAHDGSNDVFNQNVDAEVKNLRASEHVQRLVTFFRDNDFVPLERLQFNVLADSKSQGSIQAILRKDEVHTELLLKFDRQNGEAFYRLVKPFVESFGQKVTLLKAHQIAADKLPDAARINVLTYDNFVSELGAIVTRLTGEVERQVAKVWEEGEQWRKKLEEEDARRREQLAAEVQAQREEVAREREALETKQKEIDGKQQLLDRRKSLEQTLRILDAEQGKAPFTFSESAGKKRRGVNVFMIISLVLMAAAVGVTGYPIVAGRSTAWPQVSAFAVSTFALLGLIIFYIRFLAGWAAEHARTESDNYQLRLDFRRAHWVTEFMIEYLTLPGPDGQPAGTRELPQQVLDRLTTDLFRRSGAKPAQHPAEDVLEAIKRLVKRADRKD